MTPCLQLHLRGRKRRLRVALVDKASSSGYTYPLLRMRALGLDPDADFIAHNTERYVPARIEVSAPQQEEMERSERL